MNNHICIIFFLQVSFSRVWERKRKVSNQRAWWSSMFHNRQPCSLGIPFWLRTKPNILYSNSYFIYLSLYFLHRKYDNSQQQRPCCICFFNNYNEFRLVMFNVHFWFRTHYQCDKWQWASTICRRLSIHRWSLGQRRVLRLTWAEL